MESAGVISRQVQVTFSSWVQMHRVYSVERPVFAPVIEQGMKS